MNRREVIKSLGYISLHAAFPATLATFLSACKTEEGPAKGYVFFSVEQALCVKEIIDIIIPATEAKSASEVGVHSFLDEVFAKCLDPSQQQLIKEGLDAFIQEWGKTENKLVLLTELDKQAFANEENAAWFKTLKRYTLIGFFTSQEGTIKAGNYEKIPDKYIGEIHIQPSTLAHSKTFLKYYF